MLGKLGALVLALSLTGPQTALADEAHSDTSPPQVLLDPCPEMPAGEMCRRHQFAWVASHLSEGDDLAVAGVLLDGVLVDERVYDDGTGFEPYGHFHVPLGDTGGEYDHAAVVEVPPGLHEVTFYARDLAGNERSVTRTMRGADRPGRVSRLRAEQGSSKVRLTWRDAPDRGSLLHQYRVQVKGVGVFRQRFYFPDRPINWLVVGGLEPGRHVARVTALSWVGKGRARSITFRVTR